MSDNPLVKALCNPNFYPQKPVEVFLIQTHISWIFLAGQKVYKVKKPVDFGFLDFSTLEKRKFYCFEELEKNRRLAPWVYEQVAAIYKGADGGFSLTQAGLPVEYAVVMKRLPESGMFDRLLAQNRLSKELLEELARVLASFHARAATGGEVDRAGSIKTIKYNCDENFAEMEKRVGKALTREEFDFIKAYTHRFLEDNAPFFEQRVKDGRIRDGHGDLHLENICLDDNNKLAVFDCIEFSARFRCSDVASEIAFLYMDLDYSGERELAAIFVDAYIRHSSDKDILFLLPFYACYRACVRGKIYCLRADEADATPREKQEALLRASHYFNLAVEYAARHTRPFLMIVGGLTGTGKSALAEKIAQSTGAEHFLSDVERKRLAEILPSTKSPDAPDTGIYSPDLTQKTYDQLHFLAARALEQGKSVIADATFQQAARRSSMMALAKEKDADFWAVLCTISPEEARRRLDRRSRQKGAVSDGRWEIYKKQKARFEQPEEIPEKNIILLETDGPPDELARKVLVRMYR